MDHDWPSVVAQRYQTWLCLAVQAANVVWVLPRVTGVRACWTKLRSPKCISICVYAECRQFHASA
jgi:hypothetical protein